MKSFATFTEDTTPCKQWSDHDWTTLTHSATGKNSVMVCTKCNKQMKRWQIEQQNKMQAQRKLIDQIRKREDE